MRIYTYDYSQISVYMKIGVLKHSHNAAIRFNITLLLMCRSKFGSRYHAIRHSLTKSVSCKSMNILDCLFLITAVQCMKTYTFFTRTSCLTPCCFYPTESFCPQTGCCFFWRFLKIVLYNHWYECISVFIISIILLTYIFDVVITGNVCMLRQTRDMWGWGKRR